MQKAIYNILKVTAKIQLPKKYKAYNLSSIHHRNIPFLSARIQNFNIIIYIYDY